MSLSSLPKPLIFGISGTSVNDAERAVYSKIQPLGFILFKKNLENKQQVKKLCSELRAMLGRDDAPILVDQEGGSVNRLKAPTWREPPAPLELAKFAYSEIEDSLGKTKKFIYLSARLVAHEMQEVGINVNCAPIADLLVPGAHHITSTRSYGPSPQIIATLASSMLDGLQKGGAQGTVKHMLGQGRAKADSHLDMPVISESLETLEQNDFAVFKNIKNAQWGMTAHIKYDCLDKIEPVTYSRAVVDYIRNEIGFGGILVSDCLTMKALPETLAIKAARTIEAGIDIALYGGPNLDYFAQMAGNIPDVTEELLSKVTSSFAYSSENNINYKDTLAEFNDLYVAMQNEFNLLPKSSFSNELKLIMAILQERNSESADYSSPLYKA